MFVYAQYGINLAHSVPLQDQAGTTIPESEAQPGDVVIFNNEAHDGFYMGNGMIMDAPKPGGAVSIRPIWTSDYHIVRMGI
ncbi:C40 family peptidase [Curtobacterium sp. VKM Ac-2922]|nr:C40 family peptidase [Curtobacterium sp. VKM Ac-2922]